MLVVVRLNLTPFLNLVSVTFWPLVLGPVGAVIGVPLTMAVRTLGLDVDPATRWIADLMSSKLSEQTPTTPEPPPQDEPRATDQANPGGKERGRPAGERSNRLRVMSVQAVGSGGNEGCRDSLADCLVRSRMRCDFGLSDKEMTMAKKDKQKDKKKGKKGKKGKKK